MTNNSENNEKKISTSPEILDDSELENVSGGGGKGGTRKIAKFHTGERVGKIGTTKIGSVKKVHSVGNNMSHRNFYYDVYFDYPEVTGLEEYIPEGYLANN